ncbi:MAG TPA: aminopeptidase P family protein [Candidatus Fimivicinus intestinavium]|nr:aminopeptidase P family protein [Candidatus Fimivicinus intestinavium]
MKARLEALAALLPPQAQAALIVSEENRRYFTGFPSSAGVLLVARGGSVFLTDSRYIEAARGAVTGCEVEELTSLAGQLPALMKAYGVKRLLLEAGRVTLSQAERYRRMLPGVELDTGDTLDECVDALRMVKDKEEKGCIVRAQRIAEQAFERILSFIRPGVTEREVALALEYDMLSHGAQALSFETIAVAGVHSSMPHGVPSDTKISRGDFITMDYGAVVDGYHSDMTRTVAVGEVSEEQRQVYDTVLRAQKAALAALRPGVACAQADRAAREVIEAEGYGSCYRHGTGHGVGIEIHEQPVLSPSSAQVLAPGHIVTVEPGIYLPGRFGVRIEDMAFLTREGYENLTCAPKELIVLPA